MQINITGHHIDITESLRDYVTEKFDKLERHYDGIIKVQVILTVQKLRHIAEAKISLSGGEIFATAEQQNMYAAIDGLLDKLDRQLIRHKEKTSQQH